MSVLFSSLCYIALIFKVRKKYLLKVKPFFTLMTFSILADQIKYISNAYYVHNLRYVWPLN